MQRGFEDDVAGFDNVQHLTLLTWVVDAYQFFVQGDGQWRLATEFSHIGPLAGLDGLLDGVQGILRQEFELIECLVKGEGSIGIDAQLDVAGPEALADFPDE